MALTVDVPANIAAFLDTPTPAGWIDEAGGRLPEMLLDHANCELKAASTALGFLYRYPERTALAQGLVEETDNAYLLDLGPFVDDPAFPAAARARDCRARARSEERRVGKEYRSRWSPYH